MTIHDLFQKMIALGFVQETSRLSCWSSCMTCKKALPPGAPHYSIVGKGETPEWEPARCWSCLVPLLKQVLGIDVSDE